MNQHNCEDQDDPDVEVAERIARERLAKSIRQHEATHASNLATLNHYLGNVERDLLNGEKPEATDLEFARGAIDELQEDIDDIGSLFSWGVPSEES